MSLAQIKPNIKKALFLAKRQLPELVCDAVNLEGINYTLSEVMTLLDGVTVGGHNLQDEQVTLNQARAWEYLFELIKKNEFFVTKEIACELHALAAKEELLKWGCFRTGGVTIAGSDYMPPEAGHPAINLPVKRQQEFNTLMLAFYDSNNMQAMTEFMKSCISERTIKIMSE